MLRLLKVLGVLLVLLMVVVTGYAYLGDLTPEREPRSVPVTLDEG